MATSSKAWGLRVATIVAAVVSCSFLLGCRQSTKPNPTSVSLELKPFQALKGKIDIAGGTAHIPIINEAIKRINATNSDIRITVVGGGSGIGIKKVGEGLVEIGNTGRAVTDKEKDAYGLVAFPIALDGVSVIVHPTNPVAGLSAEKVKRLYGGEIANWKEVGGPDGAVHLLMRDESSGTREVFWESLLGKGTIAGHAQVTASNGAMTVAVSKDPLAIGYTSMGHLDASVKAIEIDGVAPTKENAASGKYRVTRKLYMNTKGQPGTLVQTFIDYIRGPEGARIIRDAGFIPIED